MDGLGSVVALTDSSGAVVNTYSYDPYGNTKSSTGTVANPWRFGGSYGAYHDADTGLYKIGARYYSPKLGRWTQQDPLVHLYDPVQLNRYAYAGCNPSNVIDPSGLEFTVCDGIFFAIGVGYSIAIFYFVPTAGGSLIVGIMVAAGLWGFSTLFC